MNADGGLSPTVPPVSSRDQTHYLAFTIDLQVDCNSCSNTLSVTLALEVPSHVKP